MMYLPLTILLLLPFFAFANESAVKAQHQAIRDVIKSKVVSGKTEVQSKVKTQNIVGTFPTNPMYMSYETFSDSACKTKNGAQLQLLDTCFTNGATSEKYTCSGSTLTYTRYSDTTCTTSTATNTATTTCQASGGGGMVGSYLLTDCSTASASLSGSYIVDNYYETTNCGSELISATGIVNGYCGDNGDGTSTQWSWPNWKLYDSSTTCSGSVAATVAVEPRTCTQFISGADDDSVTTGSYEVYTHSGATANKVVGFGFMAFVVFAMGYLF